MSNTLEEHDALLNEHEDDIRQIHTDIIDIKTRLGIKDMTNGQVVEYQQELKNRLDEERAERKESDKVLREDIKSVDNKVWFVVTGIIIVIAINILEARMGLLG